MCIVLNFFSLKRGKHKKLQEKLDERYIRALPTIKYPLSNFERSNVSQQKILCDFFCHLLLSRSTIHGDKRTIT